MSHNMRFPTMWYMQPAMDQTSLRIRAVWSEPLLVATVELLIEQHLKYLSLKAAAQARLSLHLSKCYIVVNHMSRLIHVSMTLTFECMWTRRTRSAYECTQGWWAPALPIGMWSMSLWNGILLLFLYRLLLLPLCMGFLCWVLILWCESWFPY